MSEVNEETLRKAEEYFAQWEKDHPETVERLKKRQSILNSLPDDFSAKVKAIIGRERSVKFIESDHPGYTSGMSLSYSESAFPEALKDLNVGDQFTAVFHFRSKVPYTDIQRTAT